MNETPRRLGKYQLLEQLGYGGMAEVWKAYDSQLQRYVAIKLLHADLKNDPDFVTRFEQEARFIASLHHSNIIQIYDFHVSFPPETPELLAYMVMEYIEGQTLARYLHTTSQRKNFPSPADLVRLYTPICLAIDYAHQKGMIHRDIKPPNILLDRRNVAIDDPIGVPILSDFGIAKLLGDVTNSTGWWVGTPLYAAPEQVMGAPASERSDIYSLSVILYETCTGVPPFQADIPAGVMMQHLHAPVTPPIHINPQLPPALSDAIIKGLAKAPEDRFSSASALGIAVAEALHMPVPESLKHMVAQATDMSSPTHIGPISGDLLSSSQPELAEAVPAGRQPAPSAVAISDPSKAPFFGVHLEPITPSDQSAEKIVTPASASNSSAPPVQATPPSLQPTTPPSFKAERRGRRRTIVTALITLVLVLVSLSALILVQFTYNPSLFSAANAVAGHAYFLNSGQLDQINSKGINDELMLDMNNAPDPPAGKVYYAWLLSDRTLSEQTVVGLGKLSVNQGHIHLLYVNQQHTNMLAYLSRILITAEDATVVPITYTPDKRSWVYYAQLSQANIPQDKLRFTMLDHMRHLLSDSPEISLLGLRGGLDMWFSRNTEKVLEWSSAARDDWQNSPDLLNRQIIRILDYADGARIVQQDAPAAGPTPLADQHDSQVGLLGQPQSPNDPPGYSFANEITPGYVYLISSHLEGAVLSPDATQSQRDLASQIQVALNREKGYLSQVRQDAKQLVVMDATQLGQPAALALLDDLVTQAQFAYSGEPDPQTGLTQGGAIWICNNIQRLASFDLKPYNNQ